MELYTKHKFDAAHFLPGHEGKCANLHGHTWLVEVWITKQTKDAMIIDFSIVKDIITQFDHKFVNDFIENPTAENIVRYFLNEFKKIGLNEVRIRVWETDSNCIEGITDEDL
jgi:6-pyruvoyltetrahydropterin/6-carboxytetrahydropterin synthase